MVTITRNYNDYNMFCRQSTNLTFMHNFIGWYQIKCVVAIRIDDHWHLMPTKIHHHKHKTDEKLSLANTSLSASRMQYTFTEQ